ncbi:MAG: enolase C-terminal domain-like protein [Rhizomicrobium sp.]
MQARRGSRLAAAEAGGTRSAALDADHHAGRPRPRWRRRPQSGPKFKLLKLKLGAGDGDIERLEAVRAARPDARLICDANEGWTVAWLEQHADTLARAGDRNGRAAPARPETTTACAA